LGAISAPVCNNAFPHIVVTLPELKQFIMLNNNIQLSVSNTVTVNVDDFRSINDLKIVNPWTM